jgi:hypothetical protein
MLSGFAVLPSFFFSMRYSRAHFTIGLALLAALASAGCYGYYQPLSASLSGRQIQLGITDSGAVVLAPQVGFGIEAVDGTVVTDTASRYMVAVSGVRRRDGLEIDWKGEPVSIPHALVSTVMERRFSRARTTLFAVATTIAMVAVKHAFGGAGGATSPGGSTGNGGGPR